MEKEEIRKEYVIEVGKFKNVPIMLKKDDIRYILTDIIDGDGTKYWCDSCQIKKEAESIPQETKSKAETLANGGTLEFTLSVPYENEHGEIYEITEYELTLEKLVHGIKNFLRIFLILTPIVPDKKNILKYDKINKMYCLNMEKMDDWIDDWILQMSLFNGLLFDPKKRKLLRKLGIKKKEW